MGNHLLQTILSLDARALRRLSNEEVLAIVRREGVQLDALTCVFFQKQAGVFERAPTYLARREADIPKRAQDRIQKGTSHQGSRSIQDMEEGGSRSPRGIDEKGCS
jgi:hypothetical protein